MIANQSLVGRENFTVVRQPLQDAEHAEEALETLSAAQSTQDNAVDADGAPQKTNIERYRAVVAQLAAAKEGIAALLRGAGVPLDRVRCAPRSARPSSQSLGTMRAWAVPARRFHVKRIVHTVPARRVHIHGIAHTAAPSARRAINIRPGPDHMLPVCMFARGARTARVPCRARVRASPAVAAQARPGAR